MAKITFMGAGSSVFAKNVLGDCMLCPSLHDAHIALYDIDAKRLRESKQMLDVLNANTNGKRAKITAHLGVANRKAALKGAGYVVNAIQVGRYDPGTIRDFEIPKKYGLRQTIADTLGIGGIFRALRTIPVMLDFAHDMEAVCPDAWMLNYTNPMAMVTAGVLRGSSVRAVGLCHSVQVCAQGLLHMTSMEAGWGAEKYKNVQWKTAGINHQGWLLEISNDGVDLYPEIKRRYAKARPELMKKGATAVRAEAQKKFGDQWWIKSPVARMSCDMVRLEIMHQFGHYLTESSEHSSEYVPWFIKRTHPELIERFGIPLDEYPRRCIAQIDWWNKRAAEIVKNPNLTHERSHEYGSRIIEAIETDVPAHIGGNVMNMGQIPNLPAKACVEIPCLVDRNGVQGCFVGDLPEQCAALNRTNINPQILTVEAALTRRKDLVYQAALLDPHTAAELSIDEIRAMCDELLAAHSDLMPKYR